MSLELVGLAACSLALFCYYYLLYPSFLSPLAKIPAAHPTAAFSSLWIKYQRYAGREIRCVYAAHCKMGSVVRIGPSEVSVASLDGLRKIYVAGLEKHPWYTQEFVNYGRPNLVSMLHRKEHSERKRMMSRVYSKSYLFSSPDLAACCRAIVLDRLLPVIQKAAARAESVNVHSLNAAANLDFNSAYLLGLQNGTNFICDSDALQHYLTMNNARLRHSGRIQAARAMEDLYMRMCESAERDVSLDNHYSSETATDVREQAKTRPVVFAKLLEGLEKCGLSIQESMMQAASEILDNVVAGHETGATTMTYLMYEMSRNRDLQTRLRAEIRTLNPPVTPSAGGLPTLEAIDRLPLLNAVLHETLRLYAPSPAPQPRVTPAEGITIDGYGPLPAGIRISSAAYVLHRNPTVWPDPLVWQPERWLHGGKGATDDMRKWFWAFSSGGRMCIGSNFAILVLKLLVTAVYTNFTTSIVDDTGIEQRDFHLSGPVSDKLFLQFHQASEV